MLRFRRLAVCLFMSLLLHGAAVLWLNELKGGEEVRRYRSRLAHEPRFEPLAGALETAAASKPASAELRRLSLPDPTDGLFADRSTAESLEFLRFEDMARADRFRGAVTVDPHSRRGVTGYINFTMLRLDGAGSYRREGSVVDELLRLHPPDLCGLFSVAGAAEGSDPLPLPDSQVGGARPRATDLLQQR
jgi:hypothetical protein